MTTSVRIKGALTDQAVNAGFRAQRTVGPFAFDVNRAALDSGDVAFGFFGEFCGETGAFRVPQIHAFQHARPVLSFGAARARLNFDVAVRRIHRLIEHAFEFKLFNVFGVTVDLSGDRFGAGFVFFRKTHVKEFFGVRDAGRKTREAADEIVEHLLFFAYFLSVFRIVPEIRVFHFLINFFEPTFLLVDVKDTP